MIEINGIKYISTKEASHSYGYSISWFKTQRYKELPPPFMKINGKGKIYYSIKELNEWFSNSVKSYKKNI